MKITQSAKEIKPCLIYNQGKSCFDYHNCCNCGGSNCGCRYCFSCASCENCLENDK